MRPRRRATARAAALALAVVAVAGCSGGGGGTPGATGASSSSSPAPETVPAGTLDAPALAAGQAWTSTVGDTATYYFSTYSSTASGGRTTVDAGFCAAAGSGAAAASSYSWALVGRDGRLYRPASGAPAAPSPAYPDSKLVPAGSCLRGWVAFSLPANVEVARVVYDPQGGAAPLAGWTP